MNDRRDILKGMTLGAGSLLLSPVVNAIANESSGNHSPRRFVFVIEGNGCDPNQVQPVGIKRHKSAQSRNDVDRLQDVPLADHELPEALQPLNDFRDRLSIIQGLSGRICGGGHSNNFGALGVYSSKAGAFGQTIDMALAEALPSTFSQVGLGISNRPEHTIIYNTSAFAKGQKVPTQCRPDLAFQTLFGSVAGGDAAQSFQVQNNLLDFMIDDVERLERRLVGSERAKLNNYLEAFESMRQRQRRLEVSRDSLLAHAPTPDDKYQSDVETDRLEAHFEIGAAALISGLTNVLTISSGSGDPYFGVKFTGLGIDFGKHGIGHGGSYKGMTAQEMSIKIRGFHIEQVAWLARQLQKVPEAGGTMLDNTVIVYMSDAAEAHHSRCWEWPFVILGNLGGRLKTDGRFLCYPKYGNHGHRTISNLYTTLLHAAGKPRDHFGMADPNLKDLDQSGPLVELLA